MTTTTSRKSGGGQLVGGGLSRVMITADRKYEVHNEGNDSRINRESRQGSNKMKNNILPTGGNFSVKVRKKIVLTLSYFRT